MKETFIQTYTGKKFDYLKATADDIDIEDIANALANICRFSGHVPDFYSVAQHTVLCSQIVPVLEQQQARFQVVEHDAVGKCEAVSEIRGTALGQGAKALVCKIKGNGVKKHVLAILAADLQADLSRLAHHFGGLKASLASPLEVEQLTACVFGAIPPFSFHPDLHLVADPVLFQRFDDIAFNAGLLEKSVIMDTQDYLRIAQPEIVDFRRLSA